MIDRSAWVTGFDDFYAPRGLHQVSDADLDCAERTALEWRAEAAAKFDRHFVPLAHRTGATVQAIFDAEPSIVRYAIERLEDVGYADLVDCPCLDCLDEPCPARDRILALRAWAKGLLALYSQPLDKALIADDQKRWATIAVLGEMQTALQ